MQKEKLRLVPASDPVLRRRARKVNNPTSLRELAEELDEIRDKFGGLGLAAPQVGISKRLFVTRLGAHFNPVVLKRSPSMEVEEEGCLSLGTITVPVARPVWIEARWTDEDGNEQEATLWNLHARVFLHELDHLDGKLITDYM